MPTGVRLYFPIYLEGTRIRIMSERFLPIHLCLTVVPSGLHFKRRTVQSDRLLKYN